MAIEESSTFDCPYCGTSAPATTVSYGRLGYAVCPVCAYDSEPNDGDER